MTNKELLEKTEVIISILTGKYRVSREKATEATYRAFARIWDRDYHPNAFFSYYKQAAFNELRTMFNYENKWQYDEDIDMAEELRAEQETDKTYITTTLDDIAAQLPDVYVKLFEFLRDGVDHREIARRLDKSHGAVRTMKTRMIQYCQAVIVTLIMCFMIPAGGIAQDTLDVGEVRIIAKDLYKTLYDTATHYDSTRTVVKNDLPVLRNVRSQHRREGGQRINFIDIKGSSQADSVIVVFENKAVKKKHKIIPDSAFTASFGTHHLFDVSVEVTAYDPQWTITYNETINLAALDTLGGLQSIRDMALAGSGTEADPYLVGTPSDLDEVRNDKAAFYEQTADIDMTFDTQDPSGLFYNSGSGWAPIGTFPFWSGTYDGADFTITGLYSNRSNADGLGLFGRFAAGGAVKNLNMESVDITNTGGGAAGIGQARVDSYLIENVSANGTVTASDNAGMVMSFVEGASGSTAVIRKCIGSGTVESTATGSSTSGAASIVGRASNFAVIENSYGFAEVRTHNVGGGVAGYMSGDATVDKSMAYSTFTDLSGSASFLGLVVGRNNFGGPVTNSFGDETVAGFSTTDGGTAKTTTQMQDIATYNDTATTGLSSAWDIVTETSHDGQEATAIWFIDDGNDYPRLWFEYTAGGGTTISANDLSHSHTLDQSSLATIILSGNELQHGHNLTPSDVPITLAGDELQHSQPLDGSNIPITVNGSDIEHSHSLEEPLIQTILLSASDLQHSHSLAQTLVTLQGTVTLQGNDLSHAHNVGQGSLGTITLTAQGLSHTHTLEGSSIAIVISPEQLQHGHNLNESLIQTIGLSPEDLSHSQILGQGSLIVQGDATQVSLSANEQYKITLSVRGIYQIETSAKELYTITLTEDEKID